MNNPVKILVGSALGAGVGYGISKLLDLNTPPIVDPQTGVVVEGRHESLRDRWERAKVAGNVAKIAKEEELRSYFRTKVGDPNAMRDQPVP